jgi:hypothetical protein
MDATRPAFRPRVVKPVECLSKGWQLIKDDYWLFLGITFVGMLIASLGPMGILQGPILCGIHLCLFHHIRGKRASFGTLFEGFNYFVDGLIASLVMILPMLVISMVFMVGFMAIMITTAASAPAGGAPPTGMIGIMLAFEVGFFLVLFVVGMAVQVVTLFAFPLIVDKKLKGFEAIKVSFAAAKANLGGVVGLVLLNGLLSFVGFLACYVGWFFVLPVTFAAINVAYEQVFAGEEELTALDLGLTNDVQADYDDQFKDPKPDAP